MNTEPVALSAAVTAALVSAVALIAAVFHLNPTLVLALNAVVVATVAVLAAYVRAKVTPIVKSLPKF